jgi:hypothetical protein
VIQNRPTTDANSRRRSWLICAALAVVLGRGPVPWLHSHEILAPEGQPDKALAWHLEHFHPAGDDEHGWHIHWTLPWNILNCPCQHDATPTDERASALEMPLDAQATVSVQADAVSCGGAPSAILSAVERWDRPPWDPLAADSLIPVEAQAPGVTLRALYCVAQC